MGAQQIYDVLCQFGLDLYLLDGGGIRASPPEAITDTARALIRAHKGALIELLRSGGGQLPPTEPPPVPAPPATCAPTAEPATTPPAPATTVPATVATKPTQNAPDGGGLPMAWSTGPTADIDAVEILQACHAYNVVLSMVGDEIQADPADMVGDLGWSIINEHRAGIVALLRERSGAIQKPATVLFTLPKVVRSFESTGFDEHGPYFEIF